MSSWPVASVGTVIIHLSAHCYIDDSRLLRTEITGEQVTLIIKTGPLRNVCPEYSRAEQVLPLPLVKY